MKIILYMASTINGHIASTDDKTEWISETEWDSYSKMVREAGCMIIGHRTYDIITTQPEFSEFKDVNVIVVAHEDFPVLSDNHTVAHSPTDAVKKLEGFSTVVVAGGGILNSAFLKEGLIDEIFLDLEPEILGRGIPLFSEADFSCELALLAVNKISDNEVQLHYRVLK